MTKEQVMTTALDMFSQYGIKSVSMDDIARNTGISKRTIYEFFEDKETLLQEAIKYHNNTMRKILSELEKGPFTALDVFVLFYEEFMKHPRWYIKRYYDDLKRYPKAVEQEEKETEQRPIYIVIQGAEKRENEIAQEVARELDKRGYGKKKREKSPSLTMSPYKILGGY